MRRPIAIATALLALASFTSEPAPRDLRDLPRLVASVHAPSVPARQWVIAAAGDIACNEPPEGRDNPDSCQFDDTADLVVGRGYDEILPLGDLQYDEGAYRAFRRFFGRTWGRAFSNLSPAPGNHEYPDGPSSGPRGYFRYFGDRVRGPDGLGYYSFDLGACPDAPCWHLISLNSELCFFAGGCGPATGEVGPGNRMYEWLSLDLAEHPDSVYPCTLAYWHHPRFSFSTGSGATSKVQPLWDLLYAASADLVLNGHSHNYQRWRPLNAAGAFDPQRGIREFVVGTGGRSHYAIEGGAMPEDLEFAQADAFGILELTLKPQGYRWAWRSAPGQPAITDSSSGLVDCARGTP